MWTENTQQQLIEGVLRHGPDILDQCLANPNEIQQYLDTIEREYLNYPRPQTAIDITHWNIPKEYREMDIEEFLVNACPPENYDRMVLELELYHKNDMIPVLKTVKYIVDTLRKNNIVWGVGRGSSVASYILYLIGIHKIDSIKYKLPIEEFFKGENNG
jgi:DNA polymerase III alpha subunit